MADLGYASGASATTQIGRLSQSTVSNFDGA
jgi:hypothetical protein